MNQENPARERILRRLAAALKTPTQPPWTHSPADAARPAFAPLTDIRARFREECAANRTELIEGRREELVRAFYKLLMDAGLAPGENPGPGAPRIYAQKPAAGGEAIWKELLRPWQGCSDGPDSGPPDDRHAASLTLAETLVARTGSLLISTAQGGRAASVLPPLHIVYARAEQIVAELDDALARLQNHGPTPARSMFSLITGPSRTADIEKMLVLGAHGPKRLVILLEM